MLQWSISSIYLYFRLEFALGPSARVRCHLDRSRSPILSMIVALVSPTAYARSLQSLVVGQRSEDTKDDRDASIECDTHERMRYALGNVLEVHGRALDEHANGNHGVEWLAGHGRRNRGRRLTKSGGTGSGRIRAEIQPAQQVGGGSTSLHVRSSNDSAECLV